MAKNDNDGKSKGKNGGDEPRILTEDEILEVSGGGNKVEPDPGKPSKPKPKPRPPRPPRPEDGGMFRKPPKGKK